MPTLTDGWRAVIATPGSRPSANLARALAEQLPEDRTTVDALLRFKETEVAIDLISKWRVGNKHGLIILDQFEELFTQNPDQEQRAFAELLGRLPLEADVHVLLSMRDDFLFQCQAFESLAPLFSELTPLGPPTGPSLRRAIVQPALRCGYRFEDESIVEEMLGEVEGQRGALPLLAFAAAQLWERRDRETGLLTKKSYEQIGGVGGALAQHAEAMLDYIGESNTPIVRELFRNLVTAQGTRASRDRDELLSVFPESEGEPFLEPSQVRSTPVPRPERPAAKHVLDSLIDARLLTSYEIAVDNEGGEPHHRVEIVHESLLTNWPRLVRWRTQDAQGAQLRDELRSQARLWEEHGRSEDYLWTGTAYKEYELWRERYPGGLTDTEEAFARAMTSFAARRKRRRRIAVSVVIAVLLAGLTIVGGFWRQAEQERRRAEAETLRAEASKLLAFAQLRFEEDPTEALAYTTASLELDDTEQARLFALRVLWEAPPALELAPDLGSLRRPEFSPDGSSLAVAGHGANSWVWSGEGREEPVQLPGHREFGEVNKAMWASNEHLVTGHFMQDFVRVWRIPGGELVRKIEFGAKTWKWQVGEGRFLAHLVETGTRSNPEIVSLRSWSLPDGEPEELGRVDWPTLGAKDWDMYLDSDGSGWWYWKGNELFYRPLPMREGVPDRLIASFENEANSYRWSDSGPLWTQDPVTGESRLWSASTSDSGPVRVVERLHGVEASNLMFVDPSHRRVLSLKSEGQAHLWDLELWPEARPLSLRRRGSWAFSHFAFPPSGDWIVVSTGGTERLTFWPLQFNRPWVVDGYRKLAAFTPDGKWVVTDWPDGLDGTYRLWPLPGNESSKGLTLAAPPGDASNSFSCLDPQSRFILAEGSSPLGDANLFYIVPLDGSPPRELGGFSEGTWSSAAAVSPKGRLVAAAAWAGEDKTLRVWDVETGDERVFDLPPGSPSADASISGVVLNVVFADESTLYTDGDGGVRRWNLETGSHELVFAVEEGSAVGAAFTPDTRRALISVGSNFWDENAEWSPLQLLDLEAGETRELSASWISDDGPLALGPSGEVVVEGDSAGIIRVGRLSGGEPHLLLGHKGVVRSVAISPDGQWIVSSGKDNTLRLWPMPDLDKPPFHTLPYDELIAKLKSLTNIRVVRDPESAEGWSVELDPFPGWGEVPTWQ